MMIMNIAIELAQFHAIKFIARELITLMGVKSHHKARRAFAGFLMSSMSSTINAPNEGYIMRLLNGDTRSFDADLKYLRSKTDASTLVSKIRQMIYEYDDEIGRASRCSGLKVSAVDNGEFIDITASSSLIIDASTSRAKMKGITVSVNKSVYMSLSVILQRRGYATDDVNSLILAMKLRYSLLADHESSLLAYSPQIYDMIPSTAKVLEMFASPFDSSSPYFCSLFPEVECLVGSIGDAFMFECAHNMHIMEYFDYAVVHPPHVETIMERAATMIVSLIDRGCKTQFIMMIPDWDIKGGNYRTYNTIKPYIRETLCTLTGEDFAAVSSSSQVHINPSGVVALRISA